MQKSWVTPHISGEKVQQFIKHVQADMEIPYVRQNLQYFSAFVIPSLAEIQTRTMTEPPLYVTNASSVHIDDNLNQASQIWNHHSNRPATTDFQTSLM